MNLFTFNKGLGVKKGLIVDLLDQVREPMIAIIQIITVILGLKVFNKLSFIKNHKLWFDKSILFYLTRLLLPFN